jgi:hypothetical protein
MTGLQSGCRESTTLSSDVIVCDDAWHRIGFTWDGSNHKLYVDDTLVAESPDTSLMDSNGIVNIGCGIPIAPANSLLPQPDPPTATTRKGSLPYYLAREPRQNRTAAYPGHHP